MQIEIKASASLARLMALGAEQLRAAVASGFNEAGKELEAAVKQKIVSNKSVKTGNLLRSIRYAVSPSGPTLYIGSAYASGGFPLVYAAQVEFGGTITGKLAWPVSREYGGIIPTESGVTGMHVREGREHTGATGSFVRPSRSGKTRILFFTGPGIGLDGKNYAPAYILADSVTQKGKPYLYPTVKGMMPDVVANVRLAIQDLLGG